VVGIKDSSKTVARNPIQVNIYLFCFEASSGIDHIVNDLFPLVKVRIACKISCSTFASSSRYLLTLILSYRNVAQRLNV